MTNLAIRQELDRILSEYLQVPAKFGGAKYTSYMLMKYYEAYKRMIQLVRRGRLLVQNYPEHYRRILGLNNNDETYKLYIDLMWQAYQIFMYGDYRYDSMKGDDIAGYFKEKFLMIKRTGKNIMSNFKVERLRFSVTQGEALVKVGERPVVQFGDTISIKGKYGEIIDGHGSLIPDDNFIQAAIKQFPDILFEAAKIEYSK